MSIEKIAPKNKDRNSPFVSSSLTGRGGGQGDIPSSLTSMGGHLEAIAKPVRELRGFLMG